MRELRGVCRGQRSIHRHGGRRGGLPGSTSRRPPTGSPSTSGSPGSGRRARSETSASCVTASGRSRAARAFSTWSRSGSTPRRCASSASRCGGPRAAAFAPARRCRPSGYRLLRIQAPLRTVRGFVLGPRSGGPGQAPSRLSAHPRGFAAEQGRERINQLALADSDAGALGACKTPPGPLPPVPARSGGVWCARARRAAQGGRAVIVVVAMNQQRRHHDIELRRPSCWLSAMVAPPSQGNEMAMLNA